MWSNSGPTVTAPAGQIWVDIDQSHTGIYRMTPSIVKLMASFDYPLQRHFVGENPRILSTWKFISWGIIHHGSLPPWVYVPWNIVHHGMLYFGLLSTLGFCPSRILSLEYYPSWNFLAWYIAPLGCVVHYDRILCPWDLPPPPGLCLLGYCQIFVRWYFVLKPSGSFCHPRPHSTRRRPF